MSAAAASSTAYPSSESAVTRRFLANAYNGDLPKLKIMARELDDGKGSAELYLSIKDELGRTALHFAAAGGMTNVCKYLIRALKLDVNLKDYGGETPLHNATLKEKYSTTVFLIDNGANLASANDKGLTALHYAAQTGRKDFLRLLVTKGADVDVMSESGTPLHCAAARRKVEAVKFLLDKKANPNTVAHHNFTPLISSIMTGSLECMLLLLKAGADPNLDSSMVAPLETACADGQTEMIKVLLDAGANPNTLSCEGLTPLEIAASSSKCNHEAMEILFPVTSPITAIRDWSYSGIITHLQSEESRKQRLAKRKDIFHHAKSQGKASFNSKEYLNAIYWFTMAMNADPLDATVLADRSLCWLQLTVVGLAISDAEAAIKLRPDCALAHYRAGIAYTMVKNYSMAAKSYSDALKLDPENEEIRAAYEYAISTQQ